jgi:hypothetical protein
MCSGFTGAIHRCAICSIALADVREEAAEHAKRNAIRFNAKDAKENAKKRFNTKSPRHNDTKIRTV